MRRGQLASALVDEIDRLVLKVNPLLFGAGVPLSAGRGYRADVMTRVACRAFESGWWSTSTCGDEGPACGVPDWSARSDGPGEHDT